jgi:cupin 2 domain-containing protein
MLRSSGQSDLGNFFSQVPRRLPEEVIEVLLQAESFWLERIISTGQATPAGDWYDQDTHEWVLLLTGGAGLLLENDPQVIIMKPGDYVHIPAHRRHRVAWTDPSQPTIWLALHYRD